MKAKKGLIFMREISDAARENVGRSSNWDQSTVAYYFNSHIDEKVDVSVECLVEAYELTIYTRIRSSSISVKRNESVEQKWEAAYPGQRIVVYELVRFL